MSPPRPAAGPVLVLGAGSVGCYLGGLLALAGLDVVFVGRARVIDGLRREGLRLSDLSGRDQHLAPALLRLHEQIPAGLRPALTLLCVKSGATAAAAQELAAALRAGSLVVSLQNGLNNATLGRSLAPQLQWRAGMVPFNIAELGPGHYHRGTAGVLAVEDDAALDALAPAWAAQGLTLKRLPDLRPLQWGKLLLNLNNPVNALSGLPLRAQLLQRGYRRCFAALQREALGLMAEAGIVPAQLTPLKPAHLPRVLALPTPLFRLLARRMLRIDTKARSSMADDLRQGRPTEIDALSGEVLRLAASLGRTAPLNERISELVKAWPQRGRAYTAAELLHSLGL